MKKLFAAAMVVGALSAPLAAQAENLKITAIAGHPPVFLWVKLLDEYFIPEVDKRLAQQGKHKVEWTKGYGGTIAKLGTELEALQDGVADLAFVSSIFQAAKLPLQNVSYYAPFGSDDVHLLTKVVEDLHKTIPAMRETWEKNGAVLISGTALDSYHLLTSFPVRTVDDIKGKKLAAPGSAANWLKGTGAVAVAANLNTYYNDIKTGVYEGTLTFMTAAAPAKLQEVAPHITRISVGAQFAGGLALSKRFHDKMPADARAVFLAVAADYGKKFAEEQTARVDVSMKALEAGGGKVVTMSPAERKRWTETMPNIAKEWAADLDKKGLPGSQVLSAYMDGLRKAGATPVRDWDKQ